MINIENMAIRTALLNGNNISRDTDFSKYIETVSEPWVIEWLTVSSSQVAIGKARVPCERTGGETIYALVSVTSPVSISWNGDVYISVSQTYIDDWELANEDGTWIATISVWTMPAKNALKLAVKSWSTITDARNMIAKVGELKTYIQSLQARMNIVEQEVAELEVDKAVEYLEQMWLVWELYSLNSTLFKQKTPSFGNSTDDCNIWDTSANTKIHIQRIASWTASNKLKLSVKKIWAPTTWLVVEIRRWVQVTLTEDAEAYWYWNELVCSWSIPYSSITTDYQDIEVSMNGQFWGTEWELLDVVVYQTWVIVNSTNYYAIGCDSTQYSEWFSYVKYDWSAYTRSKIMPYCIADWFADSLMAKTWNASMESTKAVISFSARWSSETTFTTPKSWKLFVSVYWTFNTSYKPSWSSASWSCSCTATIYVNNTQVWTHTIYSYWSSWTVIYDQMAELSDVPSWATIKVVGSSTGDWSNYSYTSWTLTFTAPWNLPTIIRPLLPKEKKGLWQRLYAISYWQLDNGMRYGDFPAENSSSATAWSITLWNCVWFKTIIDNWWNKWKIPVYKE